ncbi:MAG TPA: cytidine deaminase [Bacilli bacterium]
MDDEMKYLLGQAVQAREEAYAPYSCFKVGCALLGEDNRVFLGCNVENASYGLTNCAERTALFRAIADGYKPYSFKAIAIAGDVSRPLAPCGACRQVLVELCSPGMRVIMGNTKGEYIESTVSELLPGAFDRGAFIDDKEI